MCWESKRAKRAHVWQGSTHTQRKKKQDGRTTNGKQGREAAGNNLPALTDDDDGRMFVTKFVFAMKLFLFNWVWMKFRFVIHIYSNLYEYCI